MIVFLSCRTRALAELHSRLTELQHAQDTASQSENQNVSPPRELEDAWEEATKAVTDR